MGFHHKQIIFEVWEVGKIIVNFGTKPNGFYGGYFQAALAMSPLIVLGRSRWSSSACAFGSWATCGLESQNACFVCRAYPNFFHFASARCDFRTTLPDFMQVEKKRIHLFCIRTGWCRFLGGTSNIRAIPLGLRRSTVP